MNPDDGECSIARYIELSRVSGYRAWPYPLKGRVTLSMGQASVAVPALTPMDSIHVRGGRAQSIYRVTVFHGRFTVSAFRIVDSAQDDRDVSSIDWMMTSDSWNERSRLRAKLAEFAQTIQASVIVDHWARYCAERCLDINDASVIDAYLVLSSSLPGVLRNGSK